MQTMRPNGEGFAPALPAQFVLDGAAGPGPMRARDRRTGTRSWILPLPPGDAVGAASLAHALRSAPHAHIAQLLATQADAEAPFIQLRWQGETLSASALGSPARERAALQLLDTIHFLQALPEPLALPGLVPEQVRAMPLTGYLRLVDFGAAEQNASLDMLRAGRAAASGVLQTLLAGAGESEHDLLATWENEGAEAYPALRSALQRLHLASLAADF
jgi:hypothetical protein